VGLLYVVLAAGYTELALVLALGHATARVLQALGLQSLVLDRSLLRGHLQDREFTKKGLVKGGLAIYVLKTTQIAKPPFTKPPFVNSRQESGLRARPRVVDEWVYRVGWTINRLHTDRGKPRKHPFSDCGDPIAGDLWGKGLVACESMARDLKL